MANMVKEVDRNQQGPKGISRRDFLIGSAVGAFGLAAGGKIGALDDLTKALGLGAHDAYASHKPRKPKPIDESFDKEKLKKNVWEVFENGGSLGFDRQFVTLAPGNTNQLPFVRTNNNPFPASGPFEVEFAIQYLTAGDGSGVGLGINQQGNVPDINFWPNTPLTFRQDSTAQWLVSHGNPRKISDLPSFDYHTIKFIYDGANFTVTRDGITLPFVFPAPAVSSLWFGHPSLSAPSWSSFRLDYLKVTPS